MAEVPSARFKFVRVEIGRTQSISITANVHTLPRDGEPKADSPKHLLAENMLSIAKSMGLGAQAMASRFVLGGAWHVLKACLNHSAAAALARKVYVEVMDSPYDTVKPTIDPSSIYYSQPDSTDLHSLAKTFENVTGLVAAVTPVGEHFNHLRAAAAVQALDANELDELVRITKTQYEEMYGRGFVSRETQLQTEERRATLMAKVDVAYETLKGDE